MWRFVNALWLLVVFPATVELATSQNGTVVRTTKEFCKALYDTRIDVIHLQHPLTVSGEEWGFLRPDVKRRVEIRPLEHTEDFVLDLGGGFDLAFVSGPSGELHFHDLQIHGIYRLALGGSGSVGIMNLFHVNAPQSIHIHNSTCCFPPEVCTSISDDLRMIVASSKAALSALGVDSCTFPDAKPPFHTYMYHEGCVLPQEWDASKITGSIHFHTNTSLSCSEKCKMNARLLDIPVVQVSTADSRQLVAAIGGMISDPQILEINLLGKVVVYEHQWSNPFTIVARTGTRMLIDGRVEDGSHAALAFLANDVLIKALGEITLQLTNLKLELESFKPGFLSKTDWKFQFCDGEDYFYKWPLYLPYPFALQDSLVQIANVSVMYRTCPSNLDLDRFIASLEDFKEHFAKRDYGNLTIAPPSFSINKLEGAGIFFDQFDVSLPAFLGDGDSWSPVLLNHLELHNVTVLCESFGEPVGEIPRCFGGEGSPNGGEGKETANRTGNAAAMVSFLDLWIVFSLTAVFFVESWL